MIFASLFDVVYRIQKTPRSNPKVVHVDRLKPYLGPPLESWIPQQEGKETPKGKAEGREEGRVTRRKISKEVSRNEATGRTARAEMTDNGMRKNGPSKRTVQARGGFQNSKITTPPHYPYFGHTWRYTVQRTDR